MYGFKSRIRYSEINSKNELTMPALLDYLQDCCTFESEELGIGIEYLRTHRMAWVLSSWQIKQSRMPRMNEEITVSTWPYEVKGFYGYRNFSVTDSSGEQIASANSLWVFMDLERMRPTRVPEDVIAAYRDAFGELLPGSWEEVRKMPLPEGGLPFPAVPVAHYFIDTNRHMNNSKYVLVAEEYLEESFLTRELCVEYKKSAVLGDMLLPVVTTEPEKTTVRLLDETGKDYAIVRFIRK